MRKSVLIAALGLMSLSAVAQDAPKNEGFVFTTVKENPITSIKDQHRSSTCWSFSSLSFLEAELLRMGKGTYDFSEMFPGIMYGDSLPVHTELDAVATAYVQAIGKGRFSKLTPVWKNGISAIYDTYLGKYPETFTYEGKEYTPKSFGESLGINPDDYVSLTSYTHHPFYTQFAIEIQDNWRNGLSYNLPLDELMAVMDNAVKTGYTFAWGSDVSEQGFTRDGVAVMPDAARASELSGSDMARWTGLTAADKRKELTTKPMPEMEITQEMRQTAFDNWETTDDHGMVIFGIAKDQNGKEYFMVKNSWGLSGKYNGIWYASKAFVAYKTMNILVHKDALPKDIKKKLGLK